MLAGVYLCTKISNHHHTITYAGLQRKPSNSCSADTIYAQSLNAAVFVVHIYPLRKHRIEYALQSVKNRKMNSSELEFGIYRYEMQKGGFVVIVPYLVCVAVQIYAYTRIYNATRVRLLCVKYNSQRIKQFATILDGVPSSRPPSRMCVYFMRIQYMWCGVVLIWCVPRLLK